MSETVTMPLPAGSQRRMGLRGPRKIKAKFLLQEDFVYHRISVTLPEDWEVEEVLNPEAWAEVAWQFKGNQNSGGRDWTGSIITVRSEQHAFYVELYVRAVLDNGLIVQPIREPIYLGIKEIKSDQYRTRWNIGKRGWDVIRASDNTVVVDANKIKTKEQAQAFIDKMTG